MILSFRPISPSKSQVLLRFTHTAGQVGVVGSYEVLGPQGAILYQGCSMRHRCSRRRPASRCGRRSLPVRLRKLDSYDIGEYGTLSIDQHTGEWAYALNNAAAQDLGTDRSAFDDFVRPGERRTTPASGVINPSTEAIRIEVRGTNDAPVIVQADLSGAVTEPLGTTSRTLTALAASYLTADNVLVNGLGSPTGGGAIGFGESILARNDDGSTESVDITSVFGPSGINFFGTNYTGLYINNNGNLTFTGPLGTFTPSAITGGGIGNPIIAAFWGDVDTRTGAALAPSPGGNSTGSNLVYYDLDPVNGVMTITWDDVGYYNSHLDKLNAFQIQLIDRGGGNFDIVYRYEDVNWTTGDASGGVNGLNGPNGQAARAGYNAADGVDYFELPQSGLQADMLALPETPGNTGIPGVYVLPVRDGVVVPNTVTDTGVIQFTDVDLADAHLVSPTGTYLGSGSALGSLAVTLTSDTSGSGTAGVLTWVYSVPSASLDFLADAETITESFSITLTDQNGGVITRQIDIALTGTADATAIAGDLTAAVAFGGTDQLTFADLGEADPDDSGAGLTDTLTEASGGIVSLDGEDTLHFTAQDVIDGKAALQHDGEADSAGSDLASADGPEADASAATGILTLTVTPPPEQFLTA